MATTINAADHATDVITIVSANISQELNWSGRHPKSITLLPRSNAIRWDFVGTEGAPLSTETRQEIDADGEYLIPIRNGAARNLHRTKLLLSSGTAGTVIGVQVEW